MKSGNLKISQPNDPAEIEADQMADRVMRMSTDDSRPKSNVPNPSNTIHRKCDACEEEEGAAAETAQRKEAYASATPTPPPADTPPSIRNVVNSNGQPLDLETRNFFEPRFGADLSHIRIFTGPAAGQSARTIAARAYTLGNNIVFGSGEYKPDSEIGQHLLAHELAHVRQNQNKTPALIARSADQWLSGSVNVGALSYTELIGEIDELNQWLQRQTTSSEDTAHIEESLTSLRAEVNRRDATAREPASAVRRGSRRGSRGPAPSATTSEPLPTRYPRILTEMTTVMYEDPAEMRAEYDLIMQWLARPEISSTERSILTLERDNLAPQLNIDRHRVVNERHAERVRTALTPPDPGAVGALVDLARTIQGIAGEPGNPNLFYIYDHGERVAISREQAESLRAGLCDQLQRALRRIESNSTYYWDRYHAQVALNDEHPVIAGISGWLADVRDPGLELAIRTGAVSAQLGVLSGYINAGDMVAAARLLPDIENNYQHIRTLARAFYEGYIEGAEIAVHRLELTRDISFAVAGSIAAVVAAPVAAGFVGVGGLGLTGASATAATIGGTGLVVGTGMAGVRGTSSAGGVLLAGGSLEEAGSAFTTEAWRGFREGFIAGAGGAAARSIGLAVRGMAAGGSSLSAQMAARVGGEMLVNGTSTLVDSLWQSCSSPQGCNVEEAVQAAVRSAALSAPGALLGGSNNPVVRGLIAPFTSGATAYIGARASGASQEDALAHAGAAIASNILMSRAAHGSDADVALEARGRAMRSRTRETIASAGRTTRAYTAAAMIGLSDALPNSGFGGSPSAVDSAVPQMGTAVVEPASLPPPVRRPVETPSDIDPTSRTRPASTVGTRADTTPAAATPTPRLEADDSPTASTATARSTPDSDVNTPGTAPRPETESPSTTTARTPSVVDVTDQLTVELRAAVATVEGYIRAGDRASLDALMVNRRGTSPRTGLLLRRDANGAPAPDARFFGQAVELEMRRRILADPTLGPAVTQGGYISREIPTPPGTTPPTRPRIARGFTDFELSVGNTSLFVDVTTNRAAQVHYDRFYGENMLVMTYDFPF